MTLGDYDSQGQKTYPKELLRQRFCSNYAEILWYCSALGFFFGVRDSPASHKGLPAPEGPTTLDSRCDQNDNQKTQEDCGCPKFAAGKFSGKFRRCWKIAHRFSGSTKCYACQGLGIFRQGKWLVENWPRLSFSETIMIIEARKPRVETAKSAAKTIVRVSGL